MSYEVCWSCGFARQARMEWANSLGIIFLQCPHDLFTGLAIVPHLHALITKGFGTSRATDPILPGIILTNNHHITPRMGTPSRCRVCLQTSNQGEVLELGKGAFLHNPLNLPHSQLHWDTLSHLHSHHTLSQDTHTPCRDSECHSRCQTRCSQCNSVSGTTKVHSVQLPPTRELLLPYRTHGCMTQSDSHLLLPHPRSRWNTGSPQQGRSLL